MIVVDGFDCLHVFFVVVVVFLLFMRETFLWLRASIFFGQILWVAGK